MHSSTSPHDDHHRGRPDAVTGRTPLGWTPLSRSPGWKRVLRAAGAPVVEYLAPGLTEAVINSRLAEVGTVPGPDIVALYGWHDGIDMDRARGKPNVVAEVAPLIFLQSLAEAVSDRARAIEMADDLARQVGTDADAHWRRTGCRC
jgi:hypothetical protein